MTQLTDAFHNFAHI